MLTIQDLTPLEPFEREIITAVLSYEAEAGRELPADSFYKSLALDIQRKYKK
jgi:hypothetical protein